MTAELYIQVIEDTSENAMCGSEGWGEYDADASIAEYLRRVEAALRTAYPDAFIEVSGEENGHIPGTMRSVRVWDSVSSSRIYESDIEAEVDEIRHEVWEPFDWLIKKEAL